MVDQNRCGALRLFLFHRTRSGIAPNSYRLKAPTLFQERRLIMVLAGLVALGHFWLTTTGYEPIRIHQWTGGYMAVNGFFVLSGLLIMKSLATRNDLKSYAVSRLLRIYPSCSFHGRSPMGTRRYFCRQFGGGL